MKKLTIVVFLLTLLTLQTKADWKWENWPWTPPAQGMVWGTNNPTDRQMRTVFKEKIAAAVQVNNTGQALELSYAYQKYEAAKLYEVGRVGLTLLLIMAAVLFITEVLWPPINNWYYLHRRQREQPDSKQ